MFSSLIGSSSGAVFQPLDMIDTNSLLTSAGATVAGVVVTLMGITLAFTIAWAIFSRLRRNA